MTKILRGTKDIRAFAIDAVGTERTVFGDTAQSNTLDANFVADWFRGWGIIGSSDLPTKQDFNAMGFAISQALAYIFQMGVVEWIAAQEFNINAIVNLNGVLYKSLQDGNIGNNPTSTPAFWTLYNTTPPDATTTLKGIVELTTGAEALGGTDAVRAITSAALASSKVLSANGYLTLAGGVILQWGTFTTSATPNTGVVQNFPIAFPTLCTCVCPSNYTTSYGTPPVATVYSTSGFQQSASAASIAAKYFAIGY